MKLERNPNEKLYPCNRRQCGEKCSPYCYLTGDEKFAVDPEKYTTFGDLVAARQACSRIDDLLHECGYASGTFSNCGRPVEYRLKDC